MKVDTLTPTRNTFIDALPKRGQKVVVDMLIDPYDPISDEHVLTFMFADPDDRNTLYFLDNTKHLWLIPRDPEHLYRHPGTLGDRLFSPGAASRTFGLGQNMPCKSWRPFEGYK